MPILQNNDEYNQRPKEASYIPGGEDLPQVSLFPKLICRFSHQNPSRVFCWYNTRNGTNTAETIWKTITLEEPPVWADVMLTADGGKEDTQISGTQHFTWIWQVNVLKKYKNKSMRERRGYSYVSQMMESQFSTWCWNWQKKWTQSGTSHLVEKWTQWIIDLNENCQTTHTSRRNHRKPSWSALGKDSQTWPHKHNPC